jgi:hypothetical protein
VSCLLGYCTSHQGLAILHVTYGCFDRCWRCACVKRALSVLLLCGLFLC